MPNTSAKAPINVTRLAMWPYYESTDTYGAAFDFDKRFMTYTDSLASNSTPLFGCGVQVDQVTKIGSGALTYGIHAFTKTERNKMFGETLDAGGAVVTTGEEVIPYVACAHSEELSNGHLNLYKYFKVKFAPNEMSAQQVSDGSVTFSTTQVQGAYIRNETLDMMRAIYYDVDPTTETGAAIIENWFSAATYIGSNGLANTSTMKKGTTVINNGDSVAEGELSFNGSATGGTTPYKYSFYYRAAGSDTWTTKQEDSTTATATQTIDVSTDTDYEFKLVVKDANGVTLTRLVTATITAST